MSYIDRNLLPHELIIFRTKKHSIIFFVPAVLLLLAIFFASDNEYAHHINKLFFNQGTSLSALALSKFPIVVCLICALYTGFQQWLTYITSDYVVTNMRVVMKQGFFDRFKTDTRLSTVSHVIVEQSLLGQIFNYGNLIINNFGGTRDAFVTVALPNEFQSYVQAQLLHINPTR